MLLRLEPTTSGQVSGDKVGGQGVEFKRLTQ